MNEDRVSEFLRQADPADDGLLDGWERSGRSLMLQERVLRASATVPRNAGSVTNGPRRRVVVLALGLALVLAVAAAGYALTSSRPTSDPLSVGCYAALDQTADVAIVQMTSADERLGAVGLCARTWEGAFGKSAPDNLVACITDGGGTGVFPNPARRDPDAACASIGASTPGGGNPYGDLSADQVRSLAARLDVAYAQAQVSGCAGAADLFKSFASTLAGSGAGGWSIQDLTAPSVDWTFPDGSTGTVPAARAADGQTCADWSMDPLGARIILVSLVQVPEP